MNPHQCPTTEGILPISRAQDDLLAATAALHQHLCPRQVLGVRMGMAAGALLGLPLPQDDKRVLALVETDGCFSDGVAVATNCWVGRRTMRIYDMGKVAATFVDTESGTAWRVAPHPQARARAVALLPDAESPWHAMLEAYQRMPAEEMLTWRPVELTVDVAHLISRPGLHVPCSRCGEEIMNERELLVGGERLCLSCAGQSYYRAG
jgi:formylmethanofuran dehydrogenase subunit E